MFCHQTESTIRTDERKHQKRFTRKFFPSENGWPPVRAHLTETEVRETRVYIIYTLVGRNDFQSDDYQLLFLYSQSIEHAVSFQNRRL